MWIDGLRQRQKRVRSMRIGAGRAMMMGRGWKCAVPYALRSIMNVTLLQAVAGHFKHVMLKVELKCILVLNRAWAKQQKTVTCTKYFMPDIYIYLYVAYIKCLYGIYGASVIRCVGV